MASYNQALKNAFLAKIDEIYKGVDVYIREDIKNVAKAAMVSANDDTDVANAIMEYIQCNYYDNGNITLAKCLGFDNISKTSLYFTRQDSAQFLQKSRSDPPYPVTISTSCGSSVEMPYVNNPDEPVTIECTLYGGEDPEGKEVEFTLISSPAGSSTVRKTGERQFEVTFTKPGSYTLEGISREADGLHQESEITSTVITVLPSTNNPPSELTLTLSCGSKLQLGTGNAAQTATATIGGGIDPEGKEVTVTVECSTADKVAKVSDTEWNITLSMTGIHVIIATATDPTGLKSVKTAMVQVEGQSTSSGSSSGQFTDAKFDSGWSDFINGCYVSSVTFSIKISSGHSSNSDYLVILGKKSDGTIVILHDKFNANNRFKVIEEGTETNSTIYSKGNLSSTAHAWTKDPYTLENDIRQVKFLCETPGHADCASKATITFEMEYTYDSSLT